MPSPALSSFTYTPYTITSPSATVYLEYDPTSLPPTPAEYTRFVCISDTHEHAFPVPDGDVLLHSGDLTNTGTVKGFRATVDWLKGLGHGKKIIIAGNHDLTLHEGWYEREFFRWHGRNGFQDRADILELLQGPEAADAGIVYLQDEEYKFQAKEGGREWSIYGSPWSPWFYDWAFNYNRKDGKELVAKFPKTDILLTHGPAAHIFDRTNSGDFAGCADLRTRLGELRPRLHVVGHIHEARGGCVHSWKDRSGAEGEGDGLPVIQNFDPEGRHREEGHWEMDGAGMEVDVSSTSNAGLVSSSTPVPASIPSATTTTLPKPTDDPHSDLETVFVNAANWPMGATSIRKGRRVPFGGPGFQAIVVDLKD